MRTPEQLAALHGNAPGVEGAIRNRDAETLMEIKRVVNEHGMKGDVYKDFTNDLYALLRRNPPVPEWLEEVFNERATEREFREHLWSEVLKHMEAKKP